MHRHQWIIFLPNFILSRFYVTLYLLSYCVFHLIGAGYIHIYAYICVFIYVYVYIYIYVYVPANACYHVYMIICMFSMCAHLMYADFMIFFTYGCLVRDDLIKKFKQTYYQVKEPPCLKREPYIQILISNFPIIVWAFIYIYIYIYICNKGKCYQMAQSLFWFKSFLWISLQPNNHTVVTMSSKRGIPPCIMKLSMQ